MTRQGRGRQRCGPDLPQTTLPARRGGPASLAAGCPDGLQGPGRCLSAPPPAGSQACPQRWGGVGSPPPQVCRDAGHRGASLLPPRTPPPPNTPVLLALLCPAPRASLELASDWLTLPQDPCPVLGVLTRSSSASWPSTGALHPPGASSLRCPSPSCPAEPCTPCRGRATPRPAPTGNWWIWSPRCPGP